MDLIIFMYNTFLTVLFTCTAVILFILPNKSSRLAKLFLGSLFIVYIIDNLLVYMVEYLSSFSNFYDSHKLVIVYIKTIIVILIICFVFFIQNYILKRKTLTIHYIILTIFFSSLFFIPLILKDKIMVWCFYLIYQGIIVYINSTCLIYINHNLTTFENIELVNLLKKLTKITLLLTIFVLIEDVMIIFIFDEGTQILGRNFSENLLSIIYAMSIIKYVLNQNLIGSSTVENTNLANLEEVIIENPDTIIFNDFVKTYLLTLREQEILKLLILNKSNQEISESLFISIGTVKTHIHNIFQKVEVNKRQDLLDTYNTLKQNNISTHT